MTETTWIRQRRLRVAAQVSKHGSSKDYVDDDDDGLCWGDTHEREAKFQSASRLKRKVQALRDGVLLPSEADQELEDYIRNMKAPLPANQITTKERNKNTLYKGPEKAGFLAGDDGMHVTAFVCTGASSAAQKARGLGIQIVSDPGLANLILAKNYKSIPEPILLCAALRGCYIMDAAALDGGDRFLCCKLNQTSQLQRHVWVSAGFKEDRACHQHH